jgi:hypothetical protein
MATNRAVTIGAALGAIALAVRTPMGIERGLREAVTNVNLDKFN